MKYIAPEVVTHKRYDYTADIWSLGCIFYEMILLRLDKNMYMEAYTNQAYLDTIQDDIVKKCGYSIGISKLICEMLSKSPSQRPKAKNIVSQIHLLINPEDVQETVQEVDIKQMCDAECGREAIVECTICQTLICDECFDSSHRYGALKRHTKKPIVNKLVYNRVHSCGLNPAGQLGHCDRKHRESLQLVDKLCNEKIIEICCGYYHTLALTARGEVFSMGSNGCGELGLNLGRFDEAITPTVIKSLVGKKIVKVSSINCQHSIALADNGEVYMWGCNEVT
jgi:serine/threonine protein kinase